MAACAHAVDQNVSADRPRTHRGLDGRRRLARRHRAQGRRQDTYSASGAGKAGVASGSSLATTHGNTGRSGVSFATAPLDKDTEVTGPLTMNLWVSSTSEDMDIFVTLRNIGPDGNDVNEIG